MRSRRAACLVGVGETAYTKRGEALESEYRLALRAIVAAVADAGVDVGDIDGLSTFADERSNPWTLAADLGLRELRFATTSSIPGGGGGCAAVGEAVLAVESGLAETVVVYRSLCQGQFYRIGRAAAEMVPGGAVSGGAVAGASLELVATANDAEALQAFSTPFGVLGPSVNFALRMRRHMERYHTTSEHLGHVAVTERAYAAVNPRAIMGTRPLTLADHQASRMVADPYRLLDCCLESDGACAVVVTSAERAGDLRQSPVEVLAAAQGTDGGNLGGALLNAGSTADDYDGGGSANLARRLYGRAGLVPTDIDVAQLYDNFTGQVLWDVMRCFERTVGARDEGFVG